jgi:predicted nuclease of restriction endonuclease-like (RecB) superfamily
LIPGGFTFAGVVDPVVFHMRAFFLAYPKVDALRRQLSWTHYRLLLRVDNADARAFYEVEAVDARWSTREMERQINSLLFERLALSRDKAGVMALAQKGHEISHPSDLVKDPLVLEFAGLRQDERFRESDLENALLSKLQQFLLELGKGFAFMGRQQRITLDGEHFFIDLVFYNRLTRSFVLVDLKVGKLTHQDLGQMQMYVNFYQREITAPDENPPIGIVLCADKSEAVVRYALPEGNTQIFASRYNLHLPTEEELAAELQRERRHCKALGLRYRPPCRFRQSGGSSAGRDQQPRHAACPRAYFACRLSCRALSPLPAWHSCVRGSSSARTPPVPRRCETPACRPAWWCRWTL